MNKGIVRERTEAVDCKGEAGAAEIAQTLWNCGISKFTLRDAAGEVGHFSIVLG